MILDPTKTYKHKTLGVGKIETENLSFHPHYDELNITFFRPFHRRAGYAHVLIVDVEALEEVSDDKSASSDNCS